MKPSLLSVTLVTPECFKSVEKTLGYLAGQTIAERLEIIIVCPYLDKLEPDESMLMPFAGYKYVEIGEFNSTGKCMAAGFLNSSSPIVAYCEEHSYPEPDWAEIITQRHIESWAAVGWSVSNYNPDSLVSWVSLYTDFGKFVEPRKSYQSSYLPSHHISYKKEILQDFSLNLGNLLENEAVFLRILRSNNYLLYFEADAISYHANLSKINSFLKSEYLGGIQFAGSLVKHEGWNFQKRVASALFTPFRPLTRMPIFVRNLYQTGRIRQLLLPAIPVFLVGHIAGAIGEFIGYLFGVGDSSLKRLDIELRRYRN